MTRRHRTRAPCPTYSRSYLVTLGLVMLVTGAFLLALGSSGDPPWTAWALAAAATAALAGAALAAYGLLGPARHMEGLADATSRHEASLVIMALAYPVHLLLSPLYRRSSATQRPFRPPTHPGANARARAPGRRRRRG